MLLIEIEEPSFGFTLNLESPLNFSTVNLQPYVHNIIANLFIRLVGTQCIKFMVVTLRYIGLISEYF